MKKGDLDGAIADYDQLIQHHPEAAGAFYFSRARLKIKKSDYDGAIADCDSAIPLLPGQSGALVRAQAYSARGEAKEAKGDFADAAGDYRMASTILPSAAIYKTKFKHAQAEATKAKGDSAGSSATYETPARSNPTDKASNEDLLAADPDEQKFEAAKQEYEQAVPPGNEAARLTYLSNLAQIIDRNVAERWKTGHPNPDYLKIADAINAELKKHPTPKDSDSKKLSQLLVGKWQSPRHIYIFRRDGKYGNEDGPVDTPWRIRGNQIIYDTSATDTIILLNSEYLIYAEGDTVFFHSRVK